MLYLVTDYEDCGEESCLVIKAIYDVPKETWYDLMAKWNAHTCNPGALPRCTVDENDPDWAANWELKRELWRSQHATHVSRLQELRTQSGDQDILINWLTEQGYQPIEFETVDAIY